MMLNNEELIDNHKIFDVIDEELHKTMSLQPDSTLCVCVYVCVCVCVNFNVSFEILGTCV